MSENKEEIAQLSPKREAFCMAYVLSHNATEAAKNAGYSDKCAYVTGSRLLRDVKVQAKIAALEAPALKKAAIDTAWVIKNAMELYAVCSKTYTKTSISDTGEMTTVTLAIDAKAANQALALLAKHTGGFTDRVDHTTLGDKITPSQIVPINELTDEQKKVLREIVKNTPTKKENV
jgi:phage terminase small subunit